MASRNHFPPSLHSELSGQADAEARADAFIRRSIALRKASLHEAADAAEAFAAEELKRCINAEDAREPHPLH
jgi:hypothetical protein